MSKVPSDEDFARAKSLDSERSRGLSSIGERARRRFKRRYSLHKVHLLAQRDVDFRAYIFFQDEEDKQKCLGEGGEVEIEQFIRQELERVGHGRASEITVDFEFDSDENVSARFGGSYFNRLR